VPSSTTPHGLTGRHELEFNDDLMDFMKS